VYFKGPISVFSFGRSSKRWTLSAILIAATFVVTPETFADTTPAAPSAAPRAQAPPLADPDAAPALAPADPGAPADPSATTIAPPAPPPAAAATAAGAPPAGAPPAEAPKPLAVPAAPPPPAAAPGPPDAAGSADQAQSGARLSDVVVTAKKRVEKVQDVPLPVTVAGGKQLVDQNVTTSNDIDRLSPNLSGQTGGSRITKPRWFLRGIGTNDPSINLESPIGIYQDEVIIQYSPLQNFPLFDLERVEILKGPQGTLWGKNTTGGAIHFVSRKPTFDPSGYLLAGVGRYGERQAEGAFGGAVVGDWLAARAAFSYEEQAGWATNLRDGSTGPQFNDFASRLQLLGNVTDNVDVLLIGRYRVASTGATPSYPIGSMPGGGIQAYGGAAIYTPPYGTNPTQHDPFQAGAPSGYPLTNWGTTGTINWHLGRYTLTSISGLDVARLPVLTLGYSNVNFDQSEAYSFTHSQQFSEEVRLTSPKGDRFNWIAGAQYFNWFFFNDAQAAYFGPVASRKNYSDARFKQTDVSPAAFASAKFSFTDDLGLTGGLRYTYDKKDVQTQRLIATGSGVTFRDQNNFYIPGSLTSPLTSADSIPASASWSQLTYDLTPEYRLSKDRLLYFRFAKGFRAGTFNPAIVPAAGNTPAYLPKTNPEKLYDWEVGAKTSWFDGKLIANLAAFYYLLQDIQLNVQTPNPLGLLNAQTSTVQNAAGGDVKGLEVEINALPAKGLHVQGGLGLVRARYTDFITYQGATQVDASGNYFYRTPQVSATVSAEYTVPVGRASAVSLGTDWIYRSHIFHNAVVQSDPVQESGRYALGNAELRYMVGRLTLLAYVRNLADAEYKVLSQVVASGAYPTALGSPRTYGVQLIAKF
jgi:iron complex outermembrane receptor protein